MEKEVAAMYIVGIVGPYYSGGDCRLIDHNIANARHVMIAIANRFAENQKVGFFSAHSHTARFETLARAPEPYFLTVDDTIFDRACDAFVLLPNWRKSPGSIREHEWIKSVKRPVFKLRSYKFRDIERLLDQLENWAEKQ